MGQGKSIIKNRPLYEANQFEVFQKISDPRYGDITPLVHNVTRTSFAAIDRVIQSEEEFAHSVSELQIRSLLSHPQLVRLVNYNSKKVDEFCSTFFTEGLLYEYYSNNLQAELAERQKVRAAYREGELWYILDSLLSVVFYLQQQNICHGDIRSYNVLLTQAGEIKLGEIFKNKQSLSGFSQIVNQQLNEFYVAPQLFNSLQHFQGAPVYDLFKSEVYSVGMTVLEAATLESVSQACYDTENFVVRQDQVHRLLDVVRDNYSFELYAFLSKLLIESEAERSSPADLIVELNQPHVLQQKTLNLSLIELISQGRIEQPQEEVEEEKVVRSAPSPSKLQSPTKSVINLSEDLNSRIEAVLAMSRETIAKYGNVQESHITTTVVQQQPLVAQFAAQPISNSTVTTYQQYYAPSQQYEIQQSQQQQPLNPVVQQSNISQEIEEIVKRSAAVRASLATSQQPQPAVLEPIVRQSQVEVRQSNVPATYVPASVNYSQTFTQQPAPAVATTTYVSSQSTYSPAVVTSTPAPPQEVTNYQTVSALNFNSAEERNAYLDKILAEARQQSGVAQGQGTTQITYTNYNGLAY